MQLPLGTGMPPPTSMDRRPAESEPPTVTPRHAHGADHDDWQQYHHHQQQQLQLLSPPPPPPPTLPAKPEHLQPEHVHTELQRGLTPTSGVRVTPLDRGDAEHLLLNHADSGPGCYLFRESKKKGAQIVLSVVSIDLSVKHLKVHVGNNADGTVGFALNPGRVLGAGTHAFDLDAAELVFSSLLELKSHYSRVRGMLKYRLCEEVDPSGAVHVTVGSSATPAGGSHADEAAAKHTSTSAATRKKEGKGDQRKGWFSTLTRKKKKKERAVSSASVFTSAASSSDGDRDRGGSDLHCAGAGLNNKVEQTNYDQDVVAPDQPFQDESAYANLHHVTHHSVKAATSSPPVLESPAAPRPEKPSGTLQTLMASPNLNATPIETAAEIGVAPAPSAEQQAVSDESATVIYSDIVGTQISLKKRPPAILPKPKKMVPANSDLHDDDDSDSEIEDDSYKQMVHISVPVAKRGAYAAASVHAVDLGLANDDDDDDQPEPIYAHGGTAIARAMAAKFQAYRSEAYSAAADDGGDNGNTGDINVEGLLIDDTVESSNDVVPDVPPRPPRLPQRDEQLDVDASIGNEEFEELHTNKHTEFEEDFDDGEPGLLI